METKEGMTKEDMLQDFYQTHCIKTFTGLYMNVAEPKVDMICIEDIAHALSCMPRFAGHTPEFYSVAQHSVHCAALAPTEFKLDALLHDASEAYMMDMPKPIKNLLSDYQVYEQRLEVVIAEKFGLEYPFNPVIKKVDNKVFEIEIERVRGTHKRMKCLLPKEAEKHFLEYYKLLTQTK